MNIVKMLCSVSALGLIAAACAPGGGVSYASALNQWKVSCGVDRGSIRKTGSVWTFRTSDNYCTGGTFNQRAEITSEQIPTTHEGTYLFQSFVTMRSGVNRQYDIFQIHDGRNGCAPPLKVTVQPSGNIVLDSAFKIGPLEQNCIENTAISSGRSPDVVRRDGTEQKLDVIVGFDGLGGFSIEVRLDDRVQTRGQYTLPQDQGYYVSPYFYFKHGVYSFDVWDYELVSRDMRVVQVSQ